MVTRVFGGGGRTGTGSLVVRAAAAGFATGLRSQIVVAALARRHDAAPRAAGWRTWIPFRWSQARTALQVGAVGELIGDKLPATPSRTAPVPLVGRIAFGAFGGAAVGSEYRVRSAVALGAVLGGAGAVAGSFGGYKARTFVTSRYELPDLPVALAEDALAFGIASQVVR